MSAMCTNTHRPTETLAINFPIGSQNRGWSPQRDADLGNIEYVGEVRSLNETNCSDSI